MEYNIRSSLFASKECVNISGRVAHYRSASSTSLRNILRNFKICNAKMSPTQLKFGLFLVTVFAFMVNQTLNMYDVHGANYDKSKSIG